MRRNRRPKLPLVKTDEIKAAKKIEEIQEKYIKNFLDRYNDKFCEKRKEFEIEIIRQSLKISHSSAAYIWGQYGPFALGSKGIDYSEEVFAEWAASGETSYFEIVHELYANHSASNRLITSLAHLLPKNTREEWIGDLVESLEELRLQGVGRCARFLVALGRVCLLGFALARITLGDLVSTKKGVACSFFLPGQTSRESAWMCHIAHGID
jgi:hypothetical protein